MSPDSRTRIDLFVILVAALLAGCGGDGAAEAPGDTGPDTVVAADLSTPDLAEADDLAAADDAVEETDAPPPKPAGCIEGELQAYFGVVHAHSTNSDGDGPPEQAFAHARDAAALDIFVLTDHMEQMFAPDGLSDGERWTGCLETAASFDEPGVYVADCGFEYATALFGITGHNNVFRTPSLFPLTVDFDAFYRDLVACETCIGQFNHPGDYVEHTWHDFAYDAAADAQLNLMEFNTDADPWDFLYRALEAGWHVSPTYNQDNHDADWGSRDDRRSAFLMSELTREALYDAMVNRRSFMTWDRNASLIMKANERCWMGSILSGVDEVALSIEAADADPEEGFASIELFGPAMTPIAEVGCQGANPCTLTATLEVTAPTFFVVRAEQVDGDRLTAAPIWAAP